MFSYYVDERLKVKTTVIIIIMLTVTVTNSIFCLNTLTMRAKCNSRHNFRPYKNIIFLATVATINSMEDSIYLSPIISSPVIVNSCVDSLPRTHVVNIVYMITIKTNR